MVHATNLYNYGNSNDISKYDPVILTGSLNNKYTFFITPTGTSIPDNPDQPANVTNQAQINSLYLFSGVTAASTGLAPGGAYLDNLGIILGPRGSYFTKGVGSVTNSGSIIGTSGVAVDAAYGGSVNNLQTGTIVAQGAGAGIYIGEVPGSIMNAGQILAAGTLRGNGVVLQVGGIAQNSAGGTISSVSDHAIYADGYATVLNAGLIRVSGSGTHSAISLVKGAALTNTSGGTIAGQSDTGIYLTGSLGTTALVVNQQGGTISSTGTRAAVYTTGLSGTVLNAGVISTADSNGVHLQTGGLIQNLATGTITSTVDRAVYTTGEQGTLKNAGLLTAGGTHSTVVFDAGGTIINQTDATITSQAGNAVYLDGTTGTAGTLLNAGIVATTGVLKDGLDLLTSGYVSNAVNGIITGTAYGVHLQGLQGSVVNSGTIVTLIGLANSNRAVAVGFGFATPGASLTNASTGTISGGSGVAFAGTQGTLLNFGTITGRGLNAAVVTLAGGGLVSNLLGADIAGNYVFKSYGVAVTGDTGTVTNLGTIFGRSKAVYLGAGGTVTNGGSIGVFGGTTGGYAAVQLAGGIASTVINTGTIGATNSATMAYGIKASNGLYVDNLLQGTIAGGSGISVKQGLATVTNAGTIQGNGMNGATITANGTYGMGAFSITALGSTGIYAGGGLTLANTVAGTISGGNGVFIHGSGSVTNAGLITGQGYSGAINVFGTHNSSFYLDNAATGAIIPSMSPVPISNNTGNFSIQTVYASSTIINSGTIGRTQFRGGVVLTNNADALAGEVASVEGTQAATIVNGGTLQGITAGYSGYAALVVNAANGTITGSGINIGDGTVINAGTLTLTYNVTGNGLAGALDIGSSKYKSNSVYISNSSTGIITAAGSYLNHGIVITGNTSASVTIENSGTIVAPNAVDATGAYVFNHAGGLISGIIKPASGASTLVNAGMITADGTSGGVVSQHLVVNQAEGEILVPIGLLIGSSDTDNGTTIVNAGVIGSAATPGVAVSGAARIVVQPGAHFYGSVTGEAASGSTTGGSSASTIELAAGTGRLAGFGNQITNFNSVVFDTGAAWTIEGSGAGLGLPVISGLAPSDMIDIDGFVSQNSSFLNGYLNLTSASNGHVSLDLAGNFTTASFIISSDGAGGTDVSVACFRTGTLIATPAGETLVEDLSIGDDVVTASGEARPIKWIGKRGYMPRVVAANSKTQPILFRAGSLAEGIPRRDLFVSAQHAMFLDSVLVPAASLVNGISIVRAAAPGAILYLHIELETHDVILAEGAPAETFVDDDSRGIFHNAKEFAELYPDAPEPAGFCAPRVEDGYQLEEIRVRLAARARSLAEAIAA